MSLLPFIDWCNRLSLGIAIRKSTWLFAVIEATHLLALTVLLGTIVIVSMRLFRLILRRQAVSRVAGDMAPWTFAALSFMLLTGGLLFLAEPTKCYNSPPFRLKMVLLTLAIIYHFTLYKRVARSDDAHVASSWADRLAAGTSLVLWFSVGLAGRAIGFY